MRLWLYRKTLLVNVRYLRLKCHGIWNLFSNGRAKKYEHCCVKKKIRLAQR